MWRCQAMMPTRPVKPDAHGMQFRVGAIQEVSDHIFTLELGFSGKTTVRPSGCLQQGSARNQTALRQRRIEQCI